jgi:Holliday junction DNA helicase RuvA
LYSYIKGTIKEVTPTHIVCENNNIGYLIFTPNPYLFKINLEYTIFIYQHVREDNISLFGFLEKERRNLFIKLLGVSGIGPKSALSIMTVENALDLQKAIEEGNSKYLTTFPGIGQKSASQIILDLRGKLEDSANATQVTDVVLALEALGYSKEKIKQVLKNVDTTLDTKEIIKSALKIINK